MFVVILEVVEVSSLSAEANAFLENYLMNFDVVEVVKVKMVEWMMNYDVKVVEYVLKDVLMM